MANSWLFLIYYLIYSKPVPLKGDVYVRNSTENTENRDRFIEDDVFISVTKESNIDCMTLCAGKPTCLTYSFNAEQKLCHLRSAFLPDYASPTFPVVSNWRHFHMKGCPYLWREFGDSCYYFLNSVTLNWTDARIFCKEMVAKLAEIESYEEDIFLSSFAATLNASSTHTAAYPGYWIGGYFNEEQTWKWNATGNLFEYTNWGEHEPNGFTHENCLLMFPPINYKWTDTLCSDHVNFICERDLNLDASTVSPQILIP